MSEPLDRVELSTYKDMAVGLDEMCDFTTTLINEQDESPTESCWNTVDVSDRGHLLSPSFGVLEDAPCSRVSARERRAVAQGSRSVSPSEHLRDPLESPLMPVLGLTFCSLALSSALLVCLKWVSSKSISDRRPTPEPESALSNISDHLAKISDHLENIETDVHDLNGIEDESCSNRTICP